ncbi:hypothetical protein Halha_1275 [Halobacteroides halobius DSM 5150]|uniref:Uncharacterized protein n=1 Tax=Halobacteroides halobius (strain ATCC 35273 / DSM 5150 / MD-1) TaxID=748449 RepID=L0K870_HALHC|nr:hypothetical protein [Halobacteroides halobius]AGB41221.1 hypothetical protein Halha_1275 [Halobacteroides halobius DSM 5150]
MSMPEIPNKSQEGALVDLLESIALEETALAHLINAEAEKIERIIDDCNVTPQEIINFQKEVSKVLKTTIKKEMLLQFKLEDVLEAQEKEVRSCTDNHQDKDNNWDSEGYYKGDYYEDDLED